MLVTSFTHFNLRFYNLKQITLETSVSKENVRWWPIQRPSTRTFHCTRGVLQEVMLDWSLQRQTWRTHWPDRCKFRSLIHLIQQRNTTTQYQICQQINKNVFLGLTKDSTHGNGLNMNRPQDKRHTLQHKIWSGCFWKMYLLTLLPRLCLRHPWEARSAIVQTSVAQRKAAQHSPFLFLSFWSFD